MEDKQNNYNLANISRISNSSFCTVREQPSQLEVDTKTCLHSTFSYPLHSTVNYIDTGLDISELASGSKTLIDCDNTIKHNENLRESEFHSTNSTTKTIQDSYNTLKGNEQVKDCGIKNITLLLNSQSKDTSASHTSAKKVTSKDLPRACDTVVSRCNPIGASWVASHKATSCGWESDNDSDCDSSCLSFDVDDLSFCGDDLPNSNNNTLCMPKLLSFQNSTNNCYINQIIHKEIGAQMWGKDQSKSVCSAMSDGNCDVCKLLRMKRQKAFTDLWSGRNARFDDSESTMSLFRPEKKKKAQCNSEAYPQDKNRLPSIADRKETFAHKRKRSSPDGAQRKKMLKKSVGVRPCPEGMEDLRKKFSSSLSTVSLSNSRGTLSDHLSNGALTSDNLLCQSSDSGFTSCNNSQRQDTCSCHCLLQMNGSNSRRSESKSLCDICSENKENIPEVQSQHHMTPGSSSKLRVNKLSKSSKKHSPFLEAIPSPSPWKGDKKLIKRRIKKMKSASEQLNMETLACF